MIISKIKYSLLLIVLALFTQIHAQHISVKSFKLLDKDLTANTAGTTEVDQNGNKAALIKVVTPQTGFSFDCGSLGIVQIIQKPSEIWLYVPRGVRRVTISHPLLGILRDYDFPMPIDGARTYEMVLLSGQVETVVKNDIGGQYLVMKVLPTTATVRIDDVEMPPNNGVVSKLLSYGIHSYDVSDPLYHTKQGTFDIGSERKELSVSLKPAYGILNITSTPESGANVYIDNVASPLSKTPFKTEKLAEGKHELRVQLSQYETKTIDISVDGNGTEQQVNVPLSPNFGTVNIIAPEGCRIVINNEDKGESSWSGRLMEGLYVIEAKKESYRTTSMNINVAKGENQTITLQAPIPIYGILDISGSPIAASVYVDNKFMGTIPNIFENILIGKHHLVVKKEGFASYESDIQIKENSVYRETISLSSFVNITFSSNVNDALLKVDGTVKNLNSEIPLSLGKHQITLSKDGYQSISKEIMVNENTNTFTLNFDHNVGVYITANIIINNVYVDGKWVIPYSESKYSIPIGKHDITVKSRGHYDYKGTITVKKNGQKFFIKFKDANKQTLSWTSVHLTRDKNAVSGMTYAGDVSSKYNNCCAIESLNENNWKRCMKRMQKAAAKLGATRVLIVSEHQGGLMGSFMVVTAYAYK